MTERTPEEIAAGDWLIRQLEAWPTRVDPNSTTNVEYLMRQAAKALRSRLSPAPEGVEEHARELLAAASEGQSFVQRKLREDNYRQHNIMIPATIALKAIEQAISRPPAEQVRMREAEYARGIEDAAKAVEHIMELWGADESEWHEALDAIRALTPPPKGQNDG